MAPLPHRPPVVLTAFLGEEAILEQALSELSGSLPGVRLCVLGSDHHALAAMAASAGMQWMPLLPDSCPQDAYWCAVSTALRGWQEPVIVLRAGTALPPYWYGRMSPFAVRPDLAAFFPLGIRYPCTGIFQDCNQAPRLPVEALDTWLNRHAPGHVFDLPLFSGWSAWLDLRQFPQREHGSDTALARALIESGKTLLASDALVVDDSRFPPQPLAELYPAWHSAVLHHHPLAVMRHAMSERASRQELPPPGLEPARPVRLHLSHGWGGGLWRWVEDFAAGDRSCRNLILRPVGEPDGYGKTLVLYAADAQSPLASWTLARPVLSTALAHQEYSALLQEIITRFAVNEVLVSSLIGHSLEALATGLPTTMVCHDFYPVCPLILATWDGPCASCDTTRLGDCLQHNPGKRFFAVEPNSYWLTLREAFKAAVLQHGLRFVAPVPSVAARWQSLMPDCPPDRFSVIPHGLPPSLLASLAPRTEQQPSAVNSLPLIVVLGSLDVHKGGSLLLDALPTLLPHAEFLLLGVGESGKDFESFAGVRVIASYEREQLGALLAEHQPVLGLLLSMVPETFSYTLSELQSAGIPVAATALGAFADRIQHESDGWLFAPRKEALTDLILALLQAPERIHAVRQRLLARAPRSVAQMVAEYDQHCAEALSLARTRRPEARPLETSTEAAHGAVHVQPEASFRGALRGFAHYSEAKIRTTTRVPKILKPVLLALVRRFG